MLTPQTKFSNHVKRNTGQISGSETKSSSPGNGFRFPKERNARKLAFNEDKKENIETVSKGFKFQDTEEASSTFVYFDRRRRSPDGIDHHEHVSIHDPQAHHQTNRHHDLNSQFDPNNPLSHQVESFQNVAKQLTDKVLLGK